MTRAQNTMRHTKGIRTMERANPSVEGKTMIRLPRTIGRMCIHKHLGKTAATTVVLILLSASTFAQQKPPVVLTAATFADSCKATLEPDTTQDDQLAQSVQLLDREVCLQRVLGWRDVFYFEHVIDGGHEYDIDWSATNGQIVRVFMKYLAAHPEKENKEAFRVFEDALLDAGLLTAEKSKWVETPAAGAR
jgi:hypothetical protein